MQIADRLPIYLQQIYLVAVNSYLEQIFYIYVQNIRHTLLLFHRNWSYAICISLELEWNLVTGVWRKYIDSDNIRYLYTAEGVNGNANKRLS